MPVDDGGERREDGTAERPSPDNTPLFEAPPRSAVRALVWQPHVTPDASIVWYHGLRGELQKLACAIYAATACSQDPTMVMRRIRRLYLFIVCPLLVIAFLVFLIDARAALSSGAELDYGEGIVLWQAAHVTDWPAAYHDVSVAPHLVFHYPPAFHLAARAVSALTGDLLFAGRLVSILSVLGVSLIIGALTWTCLPLGHPTARWLGSATGALLIFTLPAWHWSCLMRVDSMAMFLSFLAIALFVLGGRRPPVIYLCFVLFVAAVFTKQTMVAAPVACLLLLFLEDWRLMIRAALFAGSLGCGTVVLLQVVTKGEFLHNIIGYNRNPFSVGQLFRLQAEHLVGSGPAVAAALVLPILYLLHVRSASSLLRRMRTLLRHSLFTRCSILTATVLMLALAVTITAGKQGANYNYFFEVDLLASLGAGLFLGWLMRHAASTSAVTYCCALLVTISFALHATRIEPSLYSSIDAFRRPAVDQGNDEVVRLLRTTPGRVYSEDMTVLYKAGKPVEAEPAIVTCLALRGQWDESSLVQDIEAGRYSIIVVTSDLENRDRYSPRVASAIEQRYLVARRLGTFVLYQPR